MESRPPLHLGVAAIEKGAFGSSSTKVANFTYSYLILIITNRSDLQMKFYDITPGGGQAVTARKRSPHSLELSRISPSDGI